jgi:hypothetical protein
MWRCQFRCTMIALALGLSLSTLPWTGIAAPAKRSAPTAPPGPAPTEDERTLALFKAKVEQFQRFLSQDPIILLKYDVSKSPTGVIYTHMRVKVLESSFDVQRSDSLVSPFIGYIHLTFDTESTVRCGDVVIDFGIGPRWLGYTTYEKAIARVHDCFQRDPKQALGNMRLSFAYQDGRWVLQDALHTNIKDRAKWLLAALGRAEPPYHHVADNQAWEALIK